MVCMSTFFKTYGCFNRKSPFFVVSIGVPAVVVYLVSENRFPKMERRCCSSTASVFPLGLGRQTIRFFVLAPQFLDELLAIIPGNVFDRQVLFALELAWGIVHDLRPLFLGHCEYAHVKSLGQRDLVRGFVISLFLFLFRTGHHK